jgi:hypothetical protein
MLSADGRLLQQIVTDKPDKPVWVNSHAIVFLSLQT